MRHSAPYWVTHSPHAAARCLPQSCPDKAWSGWPAIASHSHSQPAIASHSCSYSQPAIASHSQCPLSREPMACCNRQPATRCICAIWQCASTSQLPPCRCGGLDADQRLVVGALGRGLTCEGTAQASTAGHKHRVSASTLQSTGSKEGGHLHKHLGQITASITQSPCLQVKVSTALI